MNWIERDKQSIWHPFTPLLGVDDPLYIKSAEGVYLITEDGRKILDAVSSWWVNLHGHAHPAIAKAVAEQAASLEHVIFAGFTHKPAITLAENLLSILPDNQDKIFYSDNGSTAVEVALKMAFQYWFNKGDVRKKVIAIDGAYHGDTFGAMSVGERGDFTKPFNEHLFEVEFIDFPTPENESKVFEHFKNIIETEEVASFIFEPIVQGASGMRMYNEQFLDKLISYAQDHNILCIADEVMTGFGRIGKLFACDYISSNPDIFCLSKGLTGGAMALGVTSCTKEVIEAFTSQDLHKTFLHGHSFTANPIACAAAVASFELLTSPTCRVNLSRIEQKHKVFHAKIKGHPRIKDIRYKGTILALEFFTDKDSSYFSEMRNQLYPFFLKKNILLRPLGNLIYLIPPYIITDKELDKIYDAIEEFLAL
ncbi:adenosylmethionine--8-amino-7-oxononanoate transaminase [Fulvivirga sediminis]|uniref:Adenosylmethionine-8-amino-7-oxononanoate aminotransferase n=1 Tax=Fulvivirga sediminis TaxID=2803949 RepID=A0A937FDS9_9BACT|nr:adenosylmethionine--8-amino-7-oxononanoate transaminase [Fulvivirga sediminis]MBL3658563.1 adenosylmethionine--8-amino-7-oxononanoate transaminase [Fulvivirga sediminis]